MGRHSAVPTPVRGESQCQRCACNWGRPLKCVPTEMKQCGVHLAAQTLGAQPGGGVVVLALLALLAAAAVERRVNCSRGRRGASTSISLRRFKHTTIAETLSSTWRFRAVSTSLSLAIVASPSYAASSALASRTASWVCTAHAPPTLRHALRPLSDTTPLVEACR